MAGFLAAGGGGMPALPSSSATATSGDAASRQDNEGAVFSSPIGPNLGGLFSFALGDNSATSTPNTVSAPGLEGGGSAFEFSSIKVAAIALGVVLLWGVLNRGR